jgi:hypothetical protein
LKWSCVFSLYSVYVLYYLYWFAYAIPSLHPWNEIYLVMVYDLFNALLERVCKYFIEDFLHLYLLGLLGYNFLFDVSLCGLGIRVILALLNEFGSIHSLCTF